MSKISVQQYLINHGINLHPNQVGFPCPTEEHFNMIHNTFSNRFCHTESWSKHRQNDYLVIYKNDEFYFAGMNSSYHRSDIKKMILIPLQFNIFEEDFTL